jgi:hypothetical protein
MDNSLTQLTAVSLSPVANTLQSLDLSHNLFTEIPDSLASLISLRALNFSHCMIESLHSLTRSPLPAITALNLRGNRLASLAGIERLLSLERVDFRDNKLTDPMEIARLTGIPNMVDIYVGKNPFVRNYSKYRITIFNLFRNTPGYLDDIFIDGTQPAYTERKYLADRALPLAQPPVIKPVIAEPQPSIIPVPVSAEFPILRSDSLVEGRGDMYEKNRRSSEYGQGTQKRKKAPRRRVVDISQGETGSSPEPRRESLILEPSPLPPPAFDIEERPIINAMTETAGVTHTTEQRSPDSVKAIPPIETSLTPSILRTGSDPAALSTLGAESEAYRKKIEALKNDFGSAWLSALNDDSWDSHQRSSAFDGAFSPIGPSRPPAGPVRTASQGIVSGGRTLG